MNHHNTINAMVNYFLGWQLCEPGKKPVAGCEIMSRDHATTLVQGMLRAADALPPSPVADGHRTHSI